MMKLIFPIFFFTFLSVSYSEDKLYSFFGEDLYDKQAKKVSLENLKGKTIALYFSAKWCGHCKIFTPKLKKYYQTHKDQLEVIFISSDQSEQQMLSHMKQEAIPWLYMKHQASTSNWLEYHFDVYETPTLIFINDKTETLASDAKPFIEKQIDLAKISKAEIIKEKYKCNNCEDWHVRYMPKL